MFQICVFDQKVQKEELMWHFLNAMIKNIKIHNIIDIIEN
jgi:hypothetical protein